MGRLPVRSLNELCQHAGQFNAFQNLAARVDMDGNAILPEGDRLGLIQKAVDRHPLLLQLLQHQAHSLGGDVRVGKIAAHLQLVSGKHLAKGRTKTPAQRLIQGFSTAQADYDLSFLCGKAPRGLQAHCQRRRRTAGLP